ncbi:polysaccharide pyruvyl transferase family protein [Humitalea sp. 24SJ18S-53]|uniref:polysaccharide pyruvyl transferase family protein n=1 Tax=Humitalea sp. 24SJ18S-53 TaxID=3422307 RepID=UPI003D67CDEF
MDGVGIRYWNAVRNCGDSISSYIIKDVLKYEPVLVGRNVDHILCIGSILFMANTNSYVWSSGIIDPSKDVVVDPTKISALRGKNSMLAVRDRGYAVADVPLGDAGVLIRNISTVRQWVENSKINGCRFKAAFIPHWAQVNHRFYKKYADSPEFTVIDMRDNSLNPIKAICESEIVISQSLHGLIFAEALGKPTIWLHSRDEDLWNFKFRDWYTNVINPPASPLLFGDFTEADFSRAEVREVNVSDADLINAFPATGAVVEIKPDFVNFERVRVLSPDVVSAFPNLFDTVCRSDDLEEDDAKQVSAEFRKFLHKRYVNWAERPSTIIKKDELELSDNLKSTMLSFMEENKHIAMLSVCDRRHMGLLRGQEKLMLWKGWSVLSNVAIFDHAIMFRPTSNGDFSKSVSTIFI